MAFAYRTEALKAFDLVFGVAGSEQFRLSGEYRARMEDSERLLLRKRNPIKR